MRSLYVVCATVALLLLYWTVDSADGHGRYHSNRKSRKHKQGRIDTFHSRTNQGTKPAGCAPGSKLEIPNILEPMKIDPYRFLGRWYNYVDYFDGIEDDPPNATNTANSYSALARETLQPSTGSPAVLMEQLNNRRDPASGQCEDLIAVLSYLTPDGTVVGVGTLNPTTSLVDTSVILATDYDSYVLQYECDSYNVETGLCGAPYFYVFTRVTPDRLAARTIDTIGKTVNRLLSQYCVTFDMFLVRLWTPSLGECPLVVPNDPCYQALRQAHLDLAGVSV